MSGHPVVLAVLSIDLIGWAIFLSAARRVMAVLPHWRSESGDARQLRRERALELVGYLGRWVLGLQTAAFVLLLIGVSNLWPPYVPGAMCGTGVLQAMGAAGTNALFFRGLAVLILYCWLTAERLDRGDPQFLSSPDHGRILLLAAPFMALSTWSFGKAVTAVAAPQAVSCCAVLYDQVGRAGWVAAALFRMPASVWAVACFGGALLVAAWGWRQFRRPRPDGKWAAAASIVLIPAWALGAAMGLQTVVAPYVFQVLYHPCPWCFFLWEHHAPGFVLYGLPAWIIAETAAGWTVRGMGRRLDRAADIDARLSRAGLRISSAALLFAALAAAPVLLWRLRSGGWIN